LCVLSASGSLALTLRDGFTGVAMHGGTVFAVSIDRMCAVLT
jgi:hypothetical protein